MAFGRSARREEPPEASLDLSERLAPYGEPNAEPTTVTGPPPAVDVRLVIVDDLPAIRTMMTLAISLVDGVVLVGEAEGAVEAVDVCARVRPDVIVLDVDMPDIDGLAAMPMLRAASPSSLIVLYSNDETSRSASIAAGADGFFLKLATPPGVVLTEILDLCRREQA